LNPHDPSGGVEKSFKKGIVEIIHLSSFKHLFIVLLSTVLTFKQRLRKQQLAVEVI
jgi:hypothetical protein